MNFKKAQTIGLILAFVPALLTVVVWAVLKTKYSDLVATAALGYAILAFIAVWFTLYGTLAQLRKSMAKPKIEVVFTENGTPENIIKVIKDISYNDEFQHELKLSIVNNGNAVARCFQIDFLIPKLYRPRIGHHSLLPRGPLPPEFDISEEVQKIPLYNDGNLVFFVKKPVKICTLILGTFTEKHEQYPKEFSIEYRVYGDWKEEQEGKLKIKINKQQEAAHAIS
jgi:hypothetical protein